MPTNALVWTPQLSVHLDYLDRQHRSILKLIDVWWTRTKSGEVRLNKTRLNKVFDLLNRFTQQHLELEERVLGLLAEQLGYPYDTVDGHKERHRVFREEIMPRFHRNIVLGIAEQEDAGGSLNSIAKWWVNHIRKEDMDYARLIESLTAREREKLHLKVIRSLIEEPIVVVSFTEFLATMDEG
ncbi:MAG: hemerythrin domain-containing protein [Desulfovibrionaceae bacterium]|nr:hemerythrin domain-containing protein [Desulfovibrionaceae bacterium]